MRPSSKADSSSEDCSVLFDLEKRIEMSIFDSSPADMFVTLRLKVEISCKHQVLGWCMHQASGSRGRRTN